MKKFIPFLISGILAVGTFGCQGQEAAQTNPEASDTTEATQPAAQEASDTTAETAVKEDTAATEGEATTDTAATEGEATTDTAASEIKIDPSATDSATDPAAAEGVTDPTAAGTAEDATAVDGDVATQANKALKDKLPTSKLEAKEEAAGVVSVSGTVSSDAELQEIEPTVKSVKGVTEVKVDATVEAAPAE